MLKDPQDAILQTPDWTYDPAGNRIGEEVDGGGLIPSRHNELNQLTEDGGGPVRFAGTLDEPGQVWVGGQEALMRNRTDFEAWLELPPGIHQIDITAQDYSENSTTQTFEVHIADEGQVILTYDLNGNLVSRVSDSTVTHYEWDAANRLISIEVEEETRSEFTYDGFSRRVGIIEKEWDSQTSSFIIQNSSFHLWDGLTIAEERSGIDGATVENRFYPQGVEVVTGPESGSYTYRTDHLGSIREVVDDQGNLAARFDYSPWGELEIVSGSFDLDFGYTGHFIHQPTGLYFAPFRAYDSGLGRWTSREPLGALGPDGPNLYWYGKNSPLNYTDPTGLWNLWNPLTWGLPRQSGENPWNPVDSSAEWGATAEGAMRPFQMPGEAMAYGERNRGCNGNDSDHHAIAARHFGEQVEEQYGFVAGAFGAYGAGVVGNLAEMVGVAVDPNSYSEDFWNDIEANDRGFMDYLEKNRCPGER